MVSNLRIEFLSRTDTQVSGLRVNSVDWSLMLDQKISEMSLLEKIAQQCATPTEKPVAAPVEPQNPVISDTMDVWNLPGFGAGAKIPTSFGHVPVEALRLRDPVRTADGRFLKVQYIDTVRLDRRFLLTHPDAQPIIIPRNGLGIDAPSEQMLVSSSQRIKAPGQFGKMTTRTANDLRGIGNISRKSHGYFTYYVFHCGEPCVVNVNGLSVELDLDFLETPEE